MYCNDTRPPERSTKRRETAPSTEAEFAVALESLVQAARDNGVDVEGSWPYRYDGAFPDYEVRVERLAKPRALRGD